MLTRSYPKKAALKLVGDRWRLAQRQRTALQRCAASAADRAARESRRVEPAAVVGNRLKIDGYNVLLTVEAALGGGVLLRAVDGTLRDMASMSGHYRRVRQTTAALEAIGRFVTGLAPSSVVWYLDRPVSNSGRLAALVAELADDRSWPWQVELVPNPDPVLIAAREDLIATADSGILDRSDRWLNLARHVVESAAPAAWIVDLSNPGEATT